MGTLLFVASKKEPLCLKSVKEAISRSPGLKVVDALTVIDAICEVDAGFVGLIVLMVNGKDELLAAINFIKSSADAALRQKRVRVVVFNSVPNPKLESTLLNLGCSEIFGFDISGKTFLHKMQRHLKLIQASPPDAAAAREDGEEEAEDDDEDQECPPNTVEVLPALEHPADLWLTRPEPDARWVMGRWVVELIGPAPCAGEWNPLARAPGDPGRGVRSYEWVARDPKSAFATSGGRWVFTGREVEYLWRFNRWKFTGDRPTLVYLENTETTATRFVVSRQGAMTIARNSKAAVARLPAIEDSIAESARLRADRGGTDIGDELEYIERRKQLGADLLEISLDQAKPGRELAIDLDPEPAGKELSLDLGPKDRGRELALQPTEEKGAEAGDFRLGVDAFKPVGVRAMLGGVPTEVLETSGRRLHLRVSSGDFAPAASAPLAIVTENLEPAGTLQCQCRILVVAPEPETRGLTIDVELDTGAEEAWAGIMRSVASRQTEILRFLKLARGA